jgi:hypothetical protein
MHPLAPIVVPFNRLCFLARENRRLKVMETTIQALRKRHTSFQDNRFHALADIYNVALIILLLERELSQLTHDALFTVRAARKARVACQIAVVLYEASEDLPHILGGDFRKLVTSALFSTDEQHAFAAALKILSQFKKRHGVRLREVRNLVGAHRDHDAAKQLALLDDLSVHEFLRISVEFYQFMKAVHPLITRLLELSADWRVLLRYTSSLEEP